MRQTVVFMDWLHNTWFCQVAKATRDLGYHIVLRSGPGVAEHIYDLVDEVHESEQWDLGAMRQFLREMMSRYDVVALTTVRGILNPVCLHGSAIATLAAEAGLPHQSPEAFMRATNKFLSRDALAHAGVPTVRFAHIRSVAEALEKAPEVGFPMIVKPVQMAASSFICRVNDLEELERTVEYVHREIEQSRYARLVEFAYDYDDLDGRTHRFDSRSLLMEEYIPGTEACVECISTGDRVIPLIVSEKPVVTEHAHLVHENLSITPPVTFSDSQVEEIRDYAIEVIRAVGIVESVVHVEMRYHPARGPQLLEVNHRAGGGMSVVRTVRRFTGVDIAEAAARLATGTFQADESYPLREGEWVGMFAVFPPHAGRLASVSGVEEVGRLGSVSEVSVNAQIGADIEGDHEECFLVTGSIEADRPEEVFDAYERALELVDIDVKRAG